LQAEFLEDGLDIPKALARLTSDVCRGPLTRLPAGQQRGLAGDEHEAVGDDAMRVRADWLGMVRQFGDCSHDSTGAGLSHVSKGLCAKLWVHVSALRSVCFLIGSNKKYRSIDTSLGMLRLTKDLLAIVITSAFLIWV
jgi:hypothetical protein